MITVPSTTCPAISLGFHWLLHKCLVTLLSVADAALLAPSRPTTRMATAAQEAQLEALFVLLADSRSTNSFALAGLTLLVKPRLRDPTHLENKTELVKCLLYMGKYHVIWIAQVLSTQTLSLLDSILHVDFCWHLRGHTDNDTLFRPIVSNQAATSFSMCAQSVILSVVVVSADLVLVARVWILYRRSRILLWILLPLVAVELVGILVVSLLQVGPLQEYIHAGKDHSLRAATLSTSIPAVPRLFVAYSIPPMVVAFVMFVMTLYKCATTMVIMGPGRTPLIAMFLRDGVVWFIIVLACCVMEFVIWSRARPSLLQLVITPTTAWVPPLSFPSFLLQPVLTTS
ncbi:hypothetical protein C8F01DRAFT_1337481 [Mycena amicta]|nr:hypothetical protein C8F01DRAFT_1337481 [Mycena amicta]